MNFNFITRAIGTAQLALKANAPTLMVAGGVISMGAAAVTASRQTLSLDEVLAPHVETLDRIDSTENTLPTYGAKEAQGDRYKVYARVGAACVRHYAVPTVLFVGGAALVFGGHRIMLKRNAALAVAFTTLQNAFEKYRANVQKTMGHDFDRAMTKGFRNREVVDPETGKTEIVSEADWAADLDGDPYNRVFEQGESDQWVPDLGINKDFIEIQTQYAQQRLNHYGHLYLSDVYKSLGFQESPISRVVGWRVRYLPDGSRDIPQVDFGLNTPHSDDWKYSAENAIYLDFNCQGLIVGGDVQRALEVKS